MRQRRPPPVGSMGDEQIRWWLNELRYRRGWSWKGLGRTLGMNTVRNLSRKASGRQWIYPSESLRFTRILKRIIAGEIVFRPRINGINGDIGVLAEKPVPLVMPTKLTFDWRTGKARVVLAYQPPPLKAPDFAYLATHPRRWTGKEWDEEARGRRSP